METTITDEAERYLRQLSAEWVRPEQGQCLACFVEKMIERFGCDGTLRFALLYRDRRAPRAPSLEQTLADAGGYCDCEILMNAVEPVRANGVVGDPVEGVIALPCRGVPAGSIHPCAHWRERERGGDDDERDYDEGDYDERDYRDE